MIYGGRRHGKRERLEAHVERCDGLVPLSAESLARQHDLLRKGQKLLQRATRQKLQESDDGGGDEPASATTAVEATLATWIVVEATEAVAWA